MSFLPRFRVLLRRVSQGQGMALVKERLIDLSTMSRWMRAIVYLSYAILAAIAVLIALHGRLANTRSASAFGIAIPVGVLAASTPVLLLALALILTGAMLSHRKLRYWAVGFAALYMLIAADGARFGIMCCDPPDVLQHRPRFVLLLIMFEAVALLLLVTAWLMKKLRPSMVAALCAGSIGLAGLLVWFITAKYQPGFGEDLMLFSWIGLMLLIMPSLLTVGFDMVEWAMLFGGFTGDAMHPEKWLVGIGLACAGVALNLALAWHGLEWRYFGLIGIRAAILALTVGLLLFACVWKREPLHRLHVRHWALLGVAALVIYGGYYMWSWEDNAPPPAYNYSGTRQFSIVYPAGWQPKLMYESHNQVVFRALGDHAFVMVEGRARSAPAVTLLNDLIPGSDEFPPTKLTFPSEPDHGWDRFETTVRNSKFGKDIHFVVWHAELEAREWYLDTNWYIVGMSSPKTLAEFMPQFEAVRRSFTLLPKTVPSRLGPRVVYGLWSVLTGTWFVLAVRAASFQMVDGVRISGCGRGRHTRGQCFRRELRRRAGYLHSRPDLPLRANGHLRLEPGGVFLAAEEEQRSADPRPCPAPYPGPEHLAAVGQWPVRVVCIRLFRRGAQQYHQGNRHPRSSHP